MVNKVMLDKLLGSIVFQPMGIDYRIIEVKTNSIYDAPYNIILSFDPEKYHTEGKEFNQEYATYLYEIEDHIDSALKYLGTDSYIINSIRYEPTSKDVYRRVENKIKESMPKVAKEFKEISGVNLPKFDGLYMGYDYNRNTIRDYINYEFENSKEIPDFENNTKYTILFHRILGKYVNLETFVNYIISN